MPSLTHKFSPEIFALEINKSEMLRVRILFFFFLAAFAVFTVLNLLFPEVFLWALVGKIDGWRFPAFFGGVTVYYSLIILLMMFLQKRKKVLPYFGRIMNSLFEGILPTIALLTFMPADDKVAGLTLPPLMAYSFFIIMSVLRLNFTISLLTGLSAGISYSLLALHVLSSSSGLHETMLLFPASHIGKGIFLIVGGILAGFVGNQLKIRVVETFNSAAEREEIESLFGEHVSPQVVSALLSAKGSDLAEKKVITAMFLDIRGFTTLSEGRDPGDVYRLLNDTFSFMIRIIEEHDGIINKFLGDGFLAIFGAPVPDVRHTLNAVRAAGNISRELRTLIAQGRLPEIRIGIGIHCGEALVGNVGSQGRREYTVIGDVVNVAARIEQLNKKLSAEILVSEQVKDKLEGEITGLQARGILNLKGRQEPVQVFEYQPL